MATDLVQVTREAIAAVLDTHASLVAITGRASGNLVSWETLADDKQPVLAYLYIDGPELAADGDTRELRFQFTADAKKESQVHELLGAVGEALTQPAFFALATPLDVLSVSRFRHGINLDVTLRVSRPYGTPRLLEDSSPRLMEDGLPRLLEAA